MSSGRATASGLVSSMAPSGSATARSPCRCQDLARSRRIARLDHQPPPAIPLQLCHVQLLDQAPGVNDADALGQARDFGEDVARHEDGHALLPA